MIVLYVLLGIILLLFLLLLCPMYVYFNFSDYLEIKIKFLLFPIILFPKKRNKTEDNKIIKNKDKEKNEKLKLKSKDNKISGIIKEKGLCGFLKILKELIKIVLGSAKELFKKIYIDFIDLSIVVVGDDAADTAIKYGKIYSFISFASSVLMENLNVSKSHINVAPGFNFKESKVNCIAKIHFIPLSIVKIAISMLFNFIKNVYLNQININLRRGVSK